MPASGRQLRAPHTYPWYRGAMALYVSVAVRDPSLLLAWIKTRMRYLPLLQHRRFFRTLALTLSWAVTHPYERYALRGLHFFIAGKISVTGNARSQSYQLKCGTPTTGTLSIRNARTFGIIRTVSGCLGLTISFFF